MRAPLVLAVFVSSYLVSCQTLTFPVQAPGSLDEHHRGRVELSAGAGDVSHQTTDGAIEVDASGGMGRLQFEMTGKNIGGGIQVEGGSSETLDGIGSTSSKMDWVSVFPHFTGRITGGSQFRMPIRIGPYVDVVNLDDSLTSREHSTIGGLIEIEPEIDIVRTQNFDMRLFGGIGIGAGVTSVTTRVFSISQDFDSTGSLFRAEFGARFAFSHFTCGLSYLHREWSFAESDPLGFAFVQEMDYEFDGFVLTAGAIW